MQGVLKFATQISPLLNNQNLFLLLADIPKQRLAVHARVHGEERKVPGSRHRKNKILQKMDTVQDEDVKQVRVEAAIVDFINYLRITRFSRSHSRAV